MKEMTCREFDEIVYGYVRMELLDVRLREAAMEHTSSCSNCARRMAEAIALAEATDARGNQVKDEQAPARVEAALLAEFRTHHRRAAWRRIIEWSAAGAAAALLLIFLWTMNGKTKTPLQPALQKGVSSQSRQPLDAKAPSPAPQTPAAEVGDVKMADASLSEASADPVYSASDFVPVPFTGAIAPDDPGMVVRVQLTRASLAELGYPVASQPDDELIRADVLVDEDGWPRGVKLVR
jgi:hypothetical protein